MGWRNFYFITRHSTTHTFPHHSSTNLINLARHPIGWHKNVTSRPGIASCYGERVTSDPPLAPSHSNPLPNSSSHAGHIRCLTAGAAVIDVMNRVTARNASMQAGQQPAWELGLLATYCAGGETASVLWWLHTEAEITKRNFCRFLNYTQCFTLYAFVKDLYF